MLPSEKRQEFFDELRSFARGVRSGAYFEKRGPIDWAAHPFSTHSRAIAVMTASGPFAPAGGETILTVVLQAAARIGVLTDGQQIDDGLQGELVDDLEEIAYHVIDGDTKNSVGDRLCFPWNQGEWTQHGFHDTTIQVQGITATFMVNLA